MISPSDRTVLRFIFTQLAKQALAESVRAAKARDWDAARHYLRRAGECGLQAASLLFPSQNTHVL